jgi:hypothetical protein
MTTHQADVAHLLAASMIRPPETAPDDLTLARVIAQVVRCVPGVQGMSAGRFGTVATHGPGGRAPGVVVRRAVSGQFAIEIHLIASEALLRAALPGNASGSAARLPGTPFLLALAGQVRAAIHEAGTGHWLFSAPGIDVSIDDLA